MPKEIVFIPAAVWERIIRKAESFSDLVSGQYGSMSIDGFHLLGHWIGTEADVIATAQERFKLERRQVTLPVGKDSFVVLTDDSSAVFVQMTPKNLFARHESVIQDIENTMHDLATWAALDFKLYFSTGPCFTPPEATAHEVNIVVGAAPAGELTASQSTHLCGVMLDARGREILHPGPTSARGAVVADKEGNYVAQIIGNTIYLLIPIQGLDSLRKLNAEGGDLFASALRLAWNGYIGEKPSLEEKPLDEAAYRTFISEGGTSLPLKAIAELDRIEKEIESLLTRHRELLNKRRELAAISTMSVLENKDQLRTSNEDWARMCGRPEVERVSLVGLGIHIRTKLIVSAEWEGRRHTYGVFVIRFGVDGRVSVWCEKPEHPDGVPHPHISGLGGNCFGNVGLIIQEAAHERRYADAAEIIFGWLVSGYDPDLAIHKIAEWPVFETESAS